MLAVFICLLLPSALEYVMWVETRSLWPLSPLLPRIWQLMRTMTFSPVWAGWRALAQHWEGAPTMPVACRNTSKPGLDISGASSRGPFQHFYPVFRTCLQLASTSVVVCLASCLYLGWLFRRTTQELPTLRQAGAPQNKCEVQGQWSRWLGDLLGTLGKAVLAVMSWFFTWDGRQDLSLYFILVAVPGQRSLLMVTKDVAKGGVDLLVGESRASMSSLTSEQLAYAVEWGDSVNSYLLIEATSICTSVVSGLRQHSSYVWCKTNTLLFEISFWFHWFFL